MKFSVKFFLVTKILIFRCSKNYKWIKYPC